MLGGSLYREGPVRWHRSIVAVTTCAVLLVGATRIAGQCTSEQRLLRPPAPLPILGPRGIMIARGTDTLWVTSRIEYTVIQLNRELEVIGSFAAPLQRPVFGGGITGIAYNGVDETLFLAHPSCFESVEADRGGTATGRVVMPD